MNKNYQINNVESKFKKKAAGAWPEFNLNTGVVFDLVLFSKLGILIYDHSEASSDVVCRAYRYL